MPKVMSVKLSEAEAQPIRQIINLRHKMGDIPEAMPSAYLRRLLIQDLGVCVSNAWAISGRGHFSAPARFSTLVTHTLIEQAITEIVQGGGR